MLRPWHPWLRRSGVQASLTCEVPNRTGSFSGTRSSLDTPSASSRADRSSNTSEVALVRLANRARPPPSGARGKSSGAQIVSRVCQADEPQVSSQLAGPSGRGRHADSSCLWQRGFVYGASHTTSAPRRMQHMAVARAEPLQTCQPSCRNDDIKNCELLIFSGGARTWNEVFNTNKLVCPLDRHDSRWLKAPVSVRRPRFVDLERVLNVICHGEVAWELDTAAPDAVEPKPQSRPDN